MNPINNVVIDGMTENDQWQGDGNFPPFALFSPDLQDYVGGPYAQRQHAEEALEAMKDGKIDPFLSSWDNAEKWNKLNKD